MKIEAMSFTRKTAIARIANLAPIMSEHIMKIFLYPHADTYVPGWTGEVKKWYASIVDVSKNVKGNKSLAEDDIFETLFKPVSKPVLVQRLYRTVVAGNRELKVTDRFSEDQLRVLDTNISVLYLRMAKAMHVGLDFDTFVHQLRSDTYQQ